MEDKKQEIDAAQCVLCDKTKVLCAKEMVLQGVSDGCEIHVHITLNDKQTSMCKPCMLTSMVLLSKQLFHAEFVTIMEETAQAAVRQN